MKKNKNKALGKDFETQQIGHKKLSDFIEKQSINKNFDITLSIIDLQNLIKGINTADLMPLKGEATKKAAKLSNGMSQINQFINEASQREIDDYIAHCCSVGLPHHFVETLLGHIPFFKQAAINYSVAQDKRPSTPSIAYHNLKFSIIANILDIYVQSKDYALTSAGNEAHPTPAMKFCMEVLTLLNIHHIFTYSNIHNAIQKYKKL